MRKAQRPSTAKSNRRSRADYTSCAIFIILALVFAVPSVWTMCHLLIVHVQDTGLAMANIGRFYWAATGLLFAFVFAVASVFAGKKRG